MKDLFEALGILNENSDIAKLGKKVKQYKGWKIYKGIDDYGDEVFRLFTPDEYRPEIGYEDWETGTLEQAIDWIDNYDLDECAHNKNAINDIVNLTEEAEQHGTYCYDGWVTRYDKYIGDMKLETEAPSKSKAISNLKFKAAKESGYSSPAGIKIDENKIKFKLKEYLEDNMYPSAEAYKFVLDFVNDAAEYLGYKDNFINNREEYEKAYLYFLDLVEGIKDKKDAGRFLRKLLREKNNKDSFLTERTIEEIENNMAVNDPAYVDEFQKQVMEIGKKDSIHDKFETAEENYSDTVRMHENKRNTTHGRNLVEADGNTGSENTSGQNDQNKQNTRVDTEITLNSDQEIKNFIDSKNKNKNYKLFVRSVKFGNGVTEIPDGAFNNFMKLRYVTFPETLKTIGNKAFRNCKNLRRVVIPRSLEKVSNDSFEGAEKNLVLDCTNNSNIAKWADGVGIAVSDRPGENVHLTNTKHPIVTAVDKPTDISLDAVTDNLKRWMYALKYKVPKDAQKGFGIDILVDNMKKTCLIPLLKLTKNTDASLHEEFDGDVKDASGLDITGATLLSIEEAKQLPSDLREYDGWWWLRSPGNDSDLAAFVNYDGFVDIGGDGVDSSNFAVRPSLQISNIDSSDIQIGDVFEFGGKSFKIIFDNIAFCLSDIGTCEFRRDWAAEDANDYEKSDVKKYVDEWFNESISNQNLTESYSYISDDIPDENGLLIYSGGEVPEKYLNKVKKVIVEDGVTGIDRGAFTSCISLTSITIPPSVTIIGTGAFLDCRRLTSINIPSSVARIGAWAFEGCNSLTNIEIPSSVTIIGTEAFIKCKNLTIHCKKGSYADKYAQENNIPVEYM